MSWDIRQDLSTGDWQFDSVRDLQSVEAEQLVRQRIHVRLVIDRGQFIYDRTGNLGSRLRSFRGMGIPQSAPALEMLVREALDPMKDIAVTDVVVNTYNDGSGLVKDPRVFSAYIKYNILFALDQDVVNDEAGQFSAQVEIPI